MAASLSPTAVASRPARSSSARTPKSSRRTALDASTRFVEGLESRTLFAAVGLGNGVLPNGVDPNHLGKGDWVQSVALADNARGFTSPSQLFAFEHSLGVQWIAIKAADGNQVLTQFNADLVNAAHQNGLLVFAYGHVYGGFQNLSSVPGEIAAAKTALGFGADGYIFDAEGEWESLGLASGSSSAQREANAVRSAFPDTFLGYTTFALPSQHPNMSYQAWGANTDAVFPMAYWEQLGVTPQQMVTNLDTEFNALYSTFLATGAGNAIKPISPVGQGFGNVTGADVVDFSNAVNASQNYAYDRVLNDPLGVYGGYGSVSFFSAQDHTQDVFNQLGVISAGAPAAATNPSPASGSLLKASPILLQWDPAPRATSYDVILDGQFLGNFIINKVGITTALADGVHPWQVIAHNNVGQAASPVWTFSVDTHAPTVQTVTAPNLTTLGTQSYDFSVTFQDNLNLSTPSITQVTNGSVSTAVQVVNLTSGQVFPVRFVSVDDTTDGPVRTANFSFDAPGANGGVFSAADDGFYGIFLNPNVVEDQTQNFAQVTPADARLGVPPGYIATFSISDNAPLAAVNAPTLTAPGGTTYSFDVTYSLPAGNPNTLDVRTIGTGDVRVQFPDGTIVTPDLVSQPPDPNVPVRAATATYRFDAPGGTWDSSDNGAYKILFTGPKVTDSAGNFLPPSQVTTTAGAVVPVPGATLTVAIPSILSVTPTAASIAETSTSPAVFTVTRAGDTSADLTVTYLVGGSATAGVDYDTLPGTLTIPAGQASATIAVRPHFDLATEGNETVTLTLNSTANFTPGTAGAATLTIVDTPVPGISVSDVTVAEPATAIPSQANFVVSLSQAWPQDITFAYTTAAGTATAGSDFTPASGQVTIPAGQTSVTVSVPVLQDFVNEDDETFFLNVTPVTNNAGILDGTGTATVQNQNVKLLPFGGKTKAVYFDGRGQKVTVSLKGPGSGNVLVLADARQPTNALGIVVDNSGDNSKLVVGTKKATTLRTLQFSTALGQVDGSHVVLAGDLTAASTVGKVKLASVAGGTLSFGNGPESVNADLGTVTDSSISVAGELKSLKVVEWIDTDATRDAVTAASIGKVQSRRNFAADLLSAGDVGDVKIDGRLDDAAIRATGSIHSVTVTAARAAKVFAGLSPTQDALPTTLAEFLNTGSSIGSFTVRSHQGGAFSDTDVAAFALGKVDVGHVTTANGGQAFGVSTASIGSLKGATPIQGPFNFRDPVSGTLVTEGDFLAKIV